MNLDEYYGSPIATSDFLMHYGVKGMRWGVRKAIERGNNAALSRQYKKASKKLQKLNKAANVKEQKALQRKYAKRAGIGLGVGMLGTGGIFGAKALLRKNARNFNNAIENAMANRGLSRSTKDIENFVTSNPIGSKIHGSYIQRRANLSNAKAISAIADLAGIGYAGYAGARSLMAKNRTTNKGHAKAVAKRNEFQREMNKAFAGTKYAKGIRKAQNSNQHKKSKPTVVVNLSGKPLNTKQIQAVKKLRNSKKRIARI